MTTQPKSKSATNRKNALKSTGPKTVEGKAISAQNARSHGVLSTHLILPSESRDEFDALVSQLHEEFSPQGLLEMSLTERIAIAMWRQKRLIKAESAELSLRQRAINVTTENEIRHTLGLDVASPWVREEWRGLADFDDSQTAQECRSLALSFQSAFLEKADFKELELNYKLAYEHLWDEADAMGMTPEEFVAEEYDDDLTNYLAHIARYYFEMQDRVRIREIVAVYKQSLALPKLPETMARYQSALDNELYKAMRALRDAQGWRDERRVAEASTVSETTTQMIADATDSGSRKLK